MAAFPPASLLNKAFSSIDAWLLPPLPNVTLQCRLDNKREQPSSHASCRWHFRFGKCNCLVMGNKAFRINWGFHRAQATKNISQGSTLVLKCHKSKTEITVPRKGLGSFHKTAKKLLVWWAYYYESQVFLRVELSHYFNCIPTILMQNTTIIK